MKKRIIASALLCLSMVAALPTVAAAADSTEAEGPSGAGVYIDGTRKDFTGQPFILHDATYVSIRETSMALGATDVSWVNGVVTVTAPGLTITAVPGSYYIVANGRYLFIPDQCMFINDEVMVPIRTLAEAFGDTVVWNSDTGAVTVTASSGPIASGDQYYSSSDVYWLSRLIMAEAGNQPFLGKIAVGNVVMNRVASPQFPDTVYGVIFDKRNGSIQFTTAYSGAIHNTPSNDCVVAAKIALDGGNVTDNSLYFASTTHCWAAKTQTYTMKIGNHTFYA